LTSFPCQQHWSVPTRRCLGGQKLWIPTRFLPCSSAFLIIFFTRSNFTTLKKDNNKNQSEMCSKFVDLPILSNSVIATGAQLWHKHVWAGFVFLQKKPIGLLLPLRHFFFNNWFCWPTKETRHLSFTFTSEHQLLCPTNCTMLDFIFPLNDR
jgi:hypothetical protein